MRTKGIKVCEPLTDEEMAKIRKLLEYAESGRGDKPDLVADGFEPEIVEFGLDHNLVYYDGDHSHQWLPTDEGTALLGRLVAR